jgi:protein-glutamine gamma-glutamyltransferase
MVRTVALAGVSGLVIAVNWLRFEEPRSGGGRPFVLVLLAIAPVLLRPLWLRLVGVAVAAMLAAWVAFSVSPAALWPGGQNFFGTVASRFGSGFADFYDFRLPIDPVDHPHMHEVLLIAIFGFTLAVAVAIAARHAVLSVICFLIGAGWPATLLAGGSELGRGTVILAVVLVLLAGLTERPSRLAFVAAGTVVAGALALSSSPAVAKSAFLDWQHWDFYTRAQKAVSVGYVWDSRYDGISFPKKKTTVLTIVAPHHPYYWRATVLDRFDGTRWLERPWRGTRRERAALTPAAESKPANRLRQVVTVRGLADRHVIGATMPVRNSVRNPKADLGQGVVIALGGLQRDDRYTVSSYVASPTPTQLVRDPATYPRALTRPGRELDVARGVTLAPFAAPGRDARVLSLLSGRLLPYANVYERARSVVGETRSPYAAVVALEAWLRSTGGFTYSEQPGTTPGLPPLVGFVMDTKTGYCQHFAGAMALMARLLGIPARVAAGFLPGRYEEDHWQVTDHDAHTWVEVWFPHYGWLPFDPTPGRGRLGGTYSSTSLGFNARAAARLLSTVVSGGVVFGRGTGAGVIAHDPNRRTPRSVGDLPPSVGVTPPPPETKRSPSLLLFLVLLAAGVATAIVALKHGRRRLRYLTRDPRRVAVACARELGEILQDQRVPASDAATMRELGVTVAGTLGVDASEFARAATVARYGPPDAAREAATRARRELRELKQRLRRSLSAAERARGLISVRSLGLG